MELEGRLAEGTTFGYWTFNGKVPGPILRVRVGDTVDVHLKNSGDSTMIHSVDFHAATGPGGGAQGDAGRSRREKSASHSRRSSRAFTSTTAPRRWSPHHIANGMYGLILVEPEEGLPPVDREFYVMQGEIYTEAAFGQHGSQDFDVEKLLNERPEYFVFNGCGRRLVEAASAASQSRRDSAHLLRRRRPELHLLVPRDRGNLRQSLQFGRRPQRAVKGHTDGDGSPAAP